MTPDLWKALISADKLQDEFLINHGTAHRYDSGNQGQDDRIYPAGGILV